MPNSTRPDILERWLRLKHPDLYSDDMMAAAGQPMRDALSRAGAYSEAETTGGSPAEVIDSRLRALYMRKIEQYDTEVLEATGVTPEQYADMLLHRGDTARGGRTTAQHLSGALDKALTAFLKVEQEGGNSTDAVNLAANEVEDENPPPSKKTIREWLERVLPFSGIPKQGPGRPRKKDT